MSPSTLPAEGVTLEFLARPFRGILLQPLVVGGAVLANLLGLGRSQGRFLGIEQSLISRSRAENLLKIFLALGVAYRLNKFLSRSVLNNFTSDKSWDWQHEIVLVTGGASGIGRMIVEELSERGIKVVVFDVAEPKQPLPSTARLYKVDITSSADIHEAAEQVRKDVGNPTVLVNNAGIGINGNILELDEKEIRLTYEVNTLAHYWLVREFVPHMVKGNHGHIVTIASLASFMVHAGNVAYTGTKASALAFHEGLAQELKARYGAKKVRTTIVHPTWVRTPLIESLSSRKDFNEFVLEPSTVAKAVVGQILKAESAQLILPGRYTLVPGVRVLPSWIQESMRNSVAHLLQSPGT